MKVKCNLFKNSYSPKCEHEVTVMQVLKGIKNGKWEKLIKGIRDCEIKEERDTLKKSLPCVTFSGTFKNKRREKNIKEYSQLMIIDIDKLKSHELSRFKNSLKQDPFIISFFESPSKGLKALVKVNSLVEDHKSTAFPYVQEYFKDMHGITVDKSGKDVCRLCYVSYDPDMYYTDSYAIFDVPRNFVSQDEKRRQAHFQSLRDNGFMVESSDIRYVFDKCKRWVGESSIGMYHKGNRNNFVHALACNLNRAGMMEETAVMLIAQTYQSLKVKEVQTAVGSAYRHNKQEHGTKPILIKKTDQSNMF